MINLVIKLGNFFSIRLMINYAFILVPSLIIFYLLFRIINTNKKDELFVLFMMRVLVCFLVMMLPILYNTSSLLFSKQSSNFQNVIEYVNEDNIAFDYTISNEEKFFKRFYIGDSRTVGMYYALYGGSGNFISSVTDQERWYAKVSAGYNWFINDAINQIDLYLEKDSYDLIFLMGANDLYNANIAFNYINIISEYAINYPDSNFIVVSVNPINDSLISEHGYSVINQDVISFNNNLNEEILRINISNLNYCDTYKDIINVFETNDGLHYTAKTYRSIYNLINSCL